MSHELNQLAADFLRLRGNRNKVKYPLPLWDRAIEICKFFPVTIVAQSLQVSHFTLRRYLRSRTNHSTSSNHSSPSFPFMPINIASAPSIQIQIHSSCPITIDFNRSSEELAKLIIAIQRELPC